MKDIVEGELLKKINSPEDLKQLSLPQLQQLCEQLRRYIIDVLSENPGHLASSLGTIELTVALHYLYNVPEDCLIWDVGHQAYSHKVLTQRREAFKNIRKYGGLSGFPNRGESKYDCFGTGHASTSISAALAMAISDKLSGENRYHIAVIGDGSMTGGMAFEALNHSGSTNADLLIILNDNGISIDKRVGAMSQYFTKISSSRAYNHLKNQIWNALGGNKDQYKKHKTFFRKTLQNIKGMFSGKSNFFEALNIRYFGPIDGHNLQELISTIEKLKHIPGPKLLHIITKKGKGLMLAEQNPTIYHSPGVFDAQTGKLEQQSASKLTKFSDVFGQTLLSLAMQNKDIVAITPAMISGSGLKTFSEQLPERIFDVGICEEHAVTFAAGMAARGKKPFCCIYSSFMQRGFDQIIHDVALQNLPVVMCLDRAGLVGDDGATHHGVFDLAYMNMIPNLVVSAPKDEVQMRNLMYTALSYNGPFSIRYPRGNGFMEQWQQDFKTIPIGKAEKIYDYSFEELPEQSICVLSIGTSTQDVFKALQSLEGQQKIGFYHFVFLKPLDEQSLKEIFAKYKHIITVEDGVRIGGFGYTIEHFAHENGYHNTIKTLAISDNFIQQGTIAQLKALCKIDSSAILQAIKDINQ